MANHRFFNIMISKDKKKEIIKDLTDKLKKQKSVVFSDYTGLSVNQAQELRAKLREEGIDYVVAKKTLIDLALKEAGFKDISVKDLKGQISVTCGYEDEVLPAKTLYDFAKGNQSLKILSGIVSGQHMSEDQVIELAQLPTKQELLAKLVGSLAAPMSGMLNALESNIKSLIYILKNKPESEAKA